ncbi:hypothetical protein DH2020_034889 [Rehmannia glutinosa]|uniref:Uncharacterized protein n=1 Tax=Rehmannia glutinosa TaxID=99300 RepID=A0ABR0VBB7_REHGL
MASLNCFCSSWRKKKNKGKYNSVEPADNEKNVETLHVKLQHLQTSSESSELRSTSLSIAIPLHIPGSSRCNVKVTNHDSPIAADSAEVDYEGGDEQDLNMPMKRDSNFYFQAPLENPNEQKYQIIEGMNASCSLYIDDDGDDDMQDKMRNSNSEEILEMITSGHVSDRALGKVNFGLLQIKRSCSNLALRGRRSENRSASFQV